MVWEGGRTVGQSVYITHALPPILSSIMLLVAAGRQAGGWAGRLHTIQLSLQVRVMECSTIKQPLPLNVFENDPPNLKPLLDWLALFTTTH